MATVLPCRIAEGMPSRSEDRTFPQGCGTRLGVGLGLGAGGWGRDPFGVGAGGEALLGTMGFHGCHGGSGFLLGHVGFDFLCF